MTLRVLLGGARSGKSALAVRMAAARADRVTFVATGTSGDEEMARRIARHRAERPAAWTTIEEPVDIAGALARADASATVVVDCLTLWLSNVAEWSDHDIEAHAAAAARLAAARTGLTIAVSNEVGSGIVPLDSGVRRYRDLLGTVNAMWVGAAEHAWLVVAGRVLALAPAEGAADE